MANQWTHGWDVPMRAGPVTQLTRLLDRPLR